MATDRRLGGESMTIRWLLYEVSVATRGPLYGRLDGRLEGDSAATRWQIDGDSMATRWRLDGNSMATR